MRKRFGERLRGWRDGAVRAFRGRDPLDDALLQLTEQLGLAVDDEAAGTTVREAVTAARPAADVARSIVYAPDMDGHADSGEIVYAPVRLDGETAESHERAVVVIGRHRQELLGALISADERHADDHRWLYIGTGSYESGARPSWVRLDKVLIVPESGIRRSGTVLPRRRFERIAHRLRSDHGWT